MSDVIKHECGIALIRLRKPLKYYLKKYGTAYYGLNKLFLMMEKQRNRGQDGAGIASIKLDMPPGMKYIHKYRTTAADSINDIFDKIHTRVGQIKKYDKRKLKNVVWLKNNVEFLGELMLGHLRYATYGNYGRENCHPVLRQNNWMTRNLIMAGNFNITNNDELFKHLTDLGQHPRERSDTITILEKFGHFLDNENQSLFNKYKKKKLSHDEISDKIANELDVQRMLKRSAKDIDGGYVLAGLIGHGDAFVLRDPAGIRPAYYYMDDEVVVVASERPAIQTVFDTTYEVIHELKPGHAIIIKKNGQAGEYLCKQPVQRKSCSFERIYFSRGTDKDIYNERKELGRLLVPAVLDEIDHDIKHAVFSFIPNTAETAFYGMIKGVEDHLLEFKIKQLQKYMSKSAVIAKRPGIREVAGIHAEDSRLSGEGFTEMIGNGKLGNGLSADKKLVELFNLRPRVEKIATKDIKLRTFIASDSGRKELVAHIYDVTYGVVEKGKDTIVIIDDSIVRGTTLRESIISMLSRLGPKKIIIVSSAPQIRYPDCYGIDMSKLKDFVAFRAAIALLKERKMTKLMSSVYNECLKQQKLPLNKAKNVVKKIYEPFTDQEISDKIAQLVKPKGMRSGLKIIYQTIDNLHKAIPNHTGDWYFSGNYPTIGGIRVVNKAFINYMKNVDSRSY